MALIIVSVIMAALAPVITKKLSNAGVTIVGGGSGGGNATPSEPVGSVCGAGAFKPTGEEECKSCQFITPYCVTCADGEGTCTKCDNDHTLTADKQCKENSQCGDKAIEVMIDGEKYCVTKYNVGNSATTGGLEIDIPSGSATIVLANGTTNCSGNCCWKGTTSSSCDSANGDYSGCTRTVCNLDAAKNICNNLLLNGHSDWFLPTYYQLGALNINSNSIGIAADGLQLCDSTASYGSSKCAYRDGYCVGSHNNACYPNFLWSNSGYTYNLSSGQMNFADHRSSPAYGFSVRCMRKVGENEGATACEPGYYLSSNTCKMCNQKTANCKECNSATGACTVCNNGYELSGNKCVATGCGEHSIKVEINSEKYCITKYNLGDHGLGIPDGAAKIVNADASTSCSGNCCWQGRTSTSCNDNAYAHSEDDPLKYSSCTRTVCNFSAAESICHNLVYGGHDDWQLPTNDQLNKLDWTELSVNRGTDGLMICDHAANFNSPQCTSRDGYCKGAHSNICYPGYIWTNSTYAYYLSSGVKESSSYTGSPALAFSVRCIRKMNSNDGATTCKKGEYNESGSCKACSNKTANCKYCNASDGTCSACKDGYSLVGGSCMPTGCGEHAVKIAIDGSNYCVMKYNPGDGGVAIPNGAVNIAIAKDSSGNGTTCSENCCWQGVTTDNSCDNNFDTYGSCQRTTCNYLGASVACDNLVYMGYDDWRLPTLSEFSQIDFAAYSFNKNSEGLMLCDSSPYYGSPACGSSTWRCGGARSNYCYPYHYWNRDAWSHYLSRGTFGTQQYTEQQDYAFGARCVRKMNASEGLTNCNKGEYLSSGSCVSCEAKTPNCTACNTTTGNCIACREGYELNGNSCVSTGCGSKAVKVKIDGENYCITKYNPGDGGLEIPSGSVTIVSAGGSSCSGKCCWKDRTSNYCDDYDSNYSSCTRTVCNFFGASSVCDNLIYNGHDDWSLMTYEQFNKLDLNTYSFFKGEQGLNLCQSNAAYGSPICTHRAACIGGEGNGCWPYHHWVSNRYSFYLDTGTKHAASYTDNYPFSYRCIRKIGENEGTSECSVGNYLNGATCEPCRNHTANCSKCNSSTGACSLCDDGYELNASGGCDLTGCGAKAIKLKIDNEDYCMTKYNIGNSIVNEKEIQVPANSGVSIATAGASAADGGSCSGYCCWAGTTSQNCTSNSSYSGCTRTVCNFAAAEKICQNLVYNGYDDWVLPTHYQLNSINWTELSINRDTDGLMLCDSNSNSGSTHCASSTLCLNARSSYCYPYFIWTDTAYAHYLGGGVHSSDNYASQKDYAFGVRCIRKKT